MTIKFAAIGLTHNHIYGQVDCLLREGAELVGFWSDEEDVAAPFAQKYPQAKRAADRRALLDDKSIQLVLTSAIPAKRAEIAVAAMRAGKDVMSDKPGMTSLDQLAEIKRVQAETKRIFSVCYSEHFETRSTVKAGELVLSRRHRQGASTPSASARTRCSTISARPTSSTARNMAASSATSAATRSSSSCSSPAAMTRRSSRPQSPIAPTPIIRACRTPATCI